MPYVHEYNMFFKYTVMLKIINTLYDKVGFL